MPQFSKHVTFWPIFEWDPAIPIELIETEIEAQVDITVDRDYGADADGNRGQTRVIVEDTQLLSVGIRFPQRDWMEFSESQISDLFTDAELKGLYEEAADLATEQIQREFL